MSFFKFAPQRMASFFCPPVESYQELQDDLGQGSPTFLVPGACFVEDNFPLDREAERGVDGFISPAIYLLLGSLDPNRYQFMSQGWGPLD